MTPLPSLPILSLLLLCAPALAEAQTCFRGRPLPTCRTFWITESGIAKRVNLNPGGASDDLLATFEIGRMRNRVGGGSALGGTVFVGVTDQASDGTDVLFGLKPRFRTWLGASTSVELSPGTVFAVKDGRVGLTGHAAVNLGDFVALTGQVLALRPTSAPGGVGGGMDVGWYVGAKVGSRPGVVAAIVVPVGVVLILLAGGVPDES